MKKAGDKYDKVLDILRKSKPELDSTKDIEEKVLRRISERPQSGPDLSFLVDFLFGWVNIVWIRRSLIAVSVVLVMVFIYQQSIILKEINYLSNRIITDKDEAAGYTSADISRRLLFYRFSSGKSSGDENKITDQEIKRVIQTVEQLQNDYRDLQDMINQDPELKKLIEKKLIEFNSKKVKI
jgi:hypothetical protein